MITWGTQYAGQLGHGQVGGDDPVPAPVAGLTGVVQVAAGGVTSFALRSDGTVWGWGRGADGDLGTATYDDVAHPVRVRGLSDIVAISAGRPNLALRRDHTLWLWGADSDYRFATRHGVPVQKKGLPDTIVGLAAGGDHSLVLLADGRLLSWGDNRYGQLGDGTTTRRLRPEPVTGLPPIASVTSYQYVTFAVGRDGSLWSWGLNSFGVLGDGTQRDRRRPVRVQGIGPVRQVSAADDHAVAVLRSGSVYSWGVNNVGQLGDGTTRRSARPVRTLIEGVRAVGAGSDHVVALKQDGTLLAWGTNDFGQIARTIHRGTYYPRPVTVRVECTRMLAVGGFHNIALTF